MPSASWYPSWFFFQVVRPAKLPQGQRKRTGMKTAHKIRMNPTLNRWSISNEPVALAASSTIGGENSGRSGIRHTSWNRKRLRRAARAHTSNALALKKQFNEIREQEYPGLTT